MWRAKLRKFSCTSYLVTPLDLVTVFWQTKCVTVFCFLTILTDFPEIQLRLTGNYKFLGSIITKPNFIWLLKTKKNVSISICASDLCGMMWQHQNYLLLHIARFVVLLEKMTFDLIFDAVTVKILTLQTLIILYTFRISLKLILVAWCGSIKAIRSCTLLGLLY